MNYYRDYDPQTGRYVESDPIGLAGGVNTYAYANGQPTRFVDPEGLRGLLDKILKQLGFPPTDPQGFGEKFGAKTEAQIEGAKAGFDLAAQRCRSGGGAPQNDTYAEADCAQKVPAPTLADPRRNMDALFTCKKVYKELTKDCKASCTLYPELCMKKTSSLVEVGSETPEACEK